jgi:hypothetical protein
MYCFSANLNCAFFIHKTFEIRWQIIENFDPSIIYAFVKAWQVSSWFMEIALVFCVNTVYICIGLKIFIIFNEAY